MTTVVEVKERWESIITAEAPWGVVGKARTEADLLSLPAEDIATGVPTGGVDDLYVAVVVADSALPGNAGMWLFALRKSNECLYYDSQCNSLLLFFSVFV